MWLLSRQTLAQPRRLAVFKITSRLASTESHNPYPFPAHRNPTPHQIFHLPVSPTESEIKSRYYDLVRIYHPDKVDPSVSPEIAQARFQAISDAYDILRGRKPPHHLGIGGPTMGGWPREEGYPTTAAWRAASQARRRQELYTSGRLDDRWKDGVLVIGVALTVGLFVFQISATRREAMTDVVTRSKHAADNVYDRQQQDTASNAVKRDVERLEA